jgi:hypothetical protein
MKTDRLFRYRLYKYFRAIEVNKKDTSRSATQRNITLLYYYFYLFCLNNTVCGFRASRNVYEFGVYVNYTSQIFYEFNVVLTVHNVVHSTVKPT